MKARSSSRTGNARHCARTPEPRNGRQLDTSAFWLSTGQRALQAALAAHLAGLAVLVVACGSKPQQAPGPEIAAEGTSKVHGAPAELSSAAVAAIAAAAPGSAACTAGDEDPDDLRCTGLYREGEALPLHGIAHGIADGVREYRPAFELWSDGAAKTRWIYLPAGATIDISRMNNWVFPIGTKLWKEFRIPISGRERRVETRMLWKTAEDRWTRAVYVWSNDETQAKQVKGGVPHVEGSAAYAIPAQVDCLRCHAGKIDNVLGFEAIGLAAPEATGLTWAELTRSGLVETTPRRALPQPADLQVPGTALERRALGLLHANCGVSCHHPLGVATRFEMRLNVDETGHVGGVREARVFATAINHRSTPSQATPNQAGKVAYRIRPLDPGRSVLYTAMNHRDLPGSNAPSTQMPPLATRQIDEAGVATIRAWIESMTPAAGYPRAAP